MLHFLFVLIYTAWILASIVLVLVVLVQSGKGGGLSGLVGAGSTLGDHLGATGAEKTLNKWTTYCAVGFLILNISLVLLAPKIFRDSPFYRSKATAQTEKAANATPAPGEKEGAAATMKVGTPTPAGTMPAPAATPTPMAPAAATPVVTPTPAPTPPSGTH
jgi:preprotein translocase subunit SecG